MASPRSRSAGPALAVPAAMISANLLSYALLLVAARRLPRTGYGELVALLGVMLVATVPALATQTVAARRTAVSGSTNGLLRATAVIAGASTSTSALLAAPLVGFLHLHSIWGLVTIVVSTPALTVLGLLQGVAQGQRRFGRLAVLTMAAVGGRSFGGLVGLLAGGTSTCCLVGAAVGVWLAAGAGLAADLPALRVADSVASARELAVEALHAAHGHGAFLLLASLDVLLARHVLTATAAGTYAAGSVVTRAALWLPQSIAVLVFASLSDHQRHRRTYRHASASVAAIGAALVVGTAVLGRLAVSLVVGGRYHALDGTIWAFALIGTALAVLQLSIMAGLALRRRGRIAVIWGVGVGEITAVLVFSPHTAAGVATLLAIVTTLGAAASVAPALLHRDEHPAPAAVSSTQLIAPPGQGAGA